MIATDDVALLELSRSAFNAHLERHPETAVQLLKQMAGRLRRADETIADLALHDVESRLVRTLERLALDEAESQVAPAPAPTTSVPTGALVVRRLRPSKRWPTWSAAAARRSLAHMRRWSAVASWCRVAGRFT